MLIPLAVAVLLPASAGAQSPPAPGSSPATGPSGTSTPATTADSGELSRSRAIRIARGDPQVAAEHRIYGPLTATAEPKPGIWQVDFYANGTDRVQVIVDDATRRPVQAWTGYQIAWQMARGNPAQFGHKLNAPYVWIPLAAIFFLGLFDFRRGWRIVHLDLLVLLSFGVSEVFFNDGNIGVSVPLVYPPLVYLLARMMWIGFRGRGQGLRPSTPIAWLAVATAFLLGFRIALNIADSGVIDVGYAGVIGADHITHGQAVWGTFPSDNQFGDTYGPFNYYAYVPFELILPWSGHWDSLPAAHAAAIFFDLAAAAGLLMLGRRLRPGPTGSHLGVVLAFAWAAYPFTDYALQSNSNDSLIAALLIWALVLFASPIWRAGLLALATAAKFASLPLVPLFAAGETGLADRAGGALLSPARLRPLLVFCGVLVAATAIMLALPAIDPGLGTFYDRTIRSQIDRDSPFSVWGQDHALEWLQWVVKAFAVALALAVAFVPRRRSLFQIAGLAAAVMIAVELTAEHWFYLYIPWFFGLAMAALGAQAAPETTAPVAEPAYRGDRSPASRLPVAG